MAASHIPVEAPTFTGKYYSSLPIPTHTHYFPCTNFSQLPVVLITVMSTIKTLLLILSYAFYGSINATYKFLSSPNTSSAPSLSILLVTSLVVNPSSNPLNTLSNSFLRMLVNLFLYDKQLTHFFFSLPLQWHNTSFLLVFRYFTLFLIYTTEQPNNHPFHATIPPFFFFK